MSHHESHRARANSKAIRSEVQGDRSGRLQLRKGKKSPVHGKWKEFHFHLKYKEQKLLYFEDEQVWLWVLYYLMYWVLYMWCDDRVVVVESQTQRLAGSEGV